MESLVIEFAKINLTLGICVFIGTVFFAYKTKSLYFIPILLYLINYNLLYIFQIFFYIPSDVGKLWSILTRFCEISMFFGIILMRLYETYRVRK